MEHLKLRQRNVKQLSSDLRGIITKLTGIPAIIPLVAEMQDPSGMRRCVVSPKKKIGRLGFVVLNAKKEFV